MPPPLKATSSTAGSDILNHHSGSPGVPPPLLSGECASPLSLSPPTFSPGCFIGTGLRGHRMCQDANSLATMTTRERRNGGGTWWNPWPTVWRRPANVAGVALRSEPNWLNIVGPRVAGRRGTLIYSYLPCRRCIFWIPYCITSVLPPPAATPEVSKYTTYRIPINKYGCSAYRTLSQNC